MVLFTGMALGFIKMFDFLFVRLKQSKALSFSAFYKIQRISHFLLKHSLDCVFYPIITRISSN